MGGLPDFVIIGAAKCGTNAVATELRRHPDVFMADEEQHFFDREWDRGLDWYRQRFARAGTRLRGEKTPNYMASSKAMDRLARVIPTARLIVLLRDPVARLLSHLNHRVTQGSVNPPDPVTSTWLREKLLERPRRFDKYVARGFYARQLEGNVLSRVDRSQLLVCFTDDVQASIQRDGLQERPDGRLFGESSSSAYADLMADVCAFIGVDPPPDPSAVRGMRPYQFDVTDDAVDLLRGVFSEENKLLEAVLGQPVPW